MDLFDEAADFRDREAQEAYNRMMRRLDEVEAGEWQGHLHFLPAGVVAIGASGHPYVEINGYPRGVQTSGGHTVRPPAMFSGNYQACPHCGAYPYIRETAPTGPRPSSGRAVCARCKQ